MISSRQSAKPFEAAKTASSAAPIASVTEVFFSFNRSIIGFMIVLRYLLKPFLRPFAKSSTQFAATVTTAIFASFMLLASPRMMSSNWPSSIRGTLMAVCRSSSASFLSFHFELASLSWKSFGIFAMTLTASYSGSRSNCASSSSSSPPSSPPAPGGGSRAIFSCCDRSSLSCLGGGSSLTFSNSLSRSVCCTGFSSFQKSGFIASFSHLYSSTVKFCASARTFLSACPYILGRSLSTGFGSTVLQP